jgi:hypothetical protein
MNKNKKMRDDTQIKGGKIWKNGFHYKNLWEEKK